MKFTEKQLENWKKFEEIRQDGRMNMFDQNAMIASGLNRQEYLFCMKNYTELKKKYGIKDNFKNEILEHQKRLEEIYEKR